MAVKEMMYLDLHVHLPQLLLEVDLNRHLDCLTSNVDGLAILNYGHEADRETETFDQYIYALETCTRKYQLTKKGVVAILLNMDTGKKTLLIRGQEIDRTRQRVDISGVGISGYVMNDYPHNNPDSFPNALEVIEQIRKQGGISFLEHFCVRDISILPEHEKRLFAKTWFGKKAGWQLEKPDTPYGRFKLEKQIYPILDEVDAVEVFNGIVCLPPWRSQNNLSEEVLDEYEAKTGKQIPRLAGSDTHRDTKNIGTTGIYIPKPDLDLEGPEIIEQLRDSLPFVRMVKGYCSLPSFVRQIIFKSPRWH
jgi:hypothetical protein